MNRESRRPKIVGVVVTVALLGMSTVLLAAGGGGGGGGGGTTPVYDTSFALEYSATCLKGCHETNATLVEGYTKSTMTHAMVKCNACHGTHTAAEVGQPKPNLTGYYPGIGPTGYTVGRDRCLTCHSAVLLSGRHQNNSYGCGVTCHSPHEFSKNAG